MTQSKMTAGAGCFVPVLVLLLVVPAMSGCTESVSSGEGESGAIRLPPRHEKPEAAPNRGEGNSASPSQPSAGTSVLCDANTPFTDTPLASANQGEMGARWNSTHTELVFTRSTSLAIGKTLADATTTPFDQIQGSDWLFFPSLSADGLAIFYAKASSDGSMRSDIFMATRSDGSSAFQNAMPLLPLQNGGDYSPYVTTAGRSLYWSQIGSDQKWHLMRWSLATPGPAEDVFTDPTSWLGNPVVTGDEKTMYFSMQRGSSADVFVATRATASGPFLNAHRVESIGNDATDEMPTWVSDDQCELLVQETNGASTRLLRATRRAP